MKIKAFEQPATTGMALKIDSYTPWYGIWAGALLLLFWSSNELDRVFNLWLLLVPILFLPTLAFAGTLIISLGLNVFRRRWRRAISIFAAPLVATSLFLSFGWLGITTDLVRFEISKDYYLTQVDALPTADGRRLKSWEWGETGGAAVVNIIRVLVYDESDQIAKPRSSWSAEWLQNADGIAKGSTLYSVLHPDRISPNLYVDVSHLDGHFYVAVVSF